MEAVKADPRLTTSDTLSEPQLKDHVPKVINDFIHYLRSGSQNASQFSLDNARLHGAERSVQGYSIRELLIEIYWLRRTLFREVTRFSQGRKDELALNAFICDSVDRFLNDLESRSVAEFVEEREATLKTSTNARLRIIRLVTHELRNMFNSVGLASLMVDAQDAESLEVMQATLENCTGNMKALLDDLLGLSDILSGLAPIHVAPLHPEALMKSIEAIYRPQAEAKGLRFKTSVAPGLEEIRTDPSMVRKIMENLVGNAVKFTFSGEVSVALEKAEKGFFQIVARDTGVGIAAEDRQLVFTEFYQVKPESPTRGLGLGLAIVSGLVELLQGTITLSSEENGGSMFRVKLPCGRPT